MLTPAHGLDLDAWIVSPSRLWALRRSGLLEVVGDPILDGITRTVQRELDVDAALITVIEADRQTFLSGCGLLGGDEIGRGTPVDRSFCRRVGWTGEPWRVDDLDLEPDDALVCELRETTRVRGYLGVPLSAPDGWTLGSLCAVTEAPRAWADDDVVAMRNLAPLASARLLMLAGR